MRVEMYIQMLQYIIVLYCIVLHLIVLNSASLNMSLSEGLPMHANLREQTG